MKNLITIFLLVLVGFTTQAQEKKNKNAKYVTEVNGNCDMCKKRIEKAAFSVKGVKSAVWHADHQDLHLIIDESKKHSKTISDLQVLLFCYFDY